MWRVLKAALLFGLCMLTLPGSLAGASLKAGVAKVEITPPTGLRMYGFASRKGTSTGILDPLFARVLVLEAGEKRLALVVSDLGRPFGPALLARLRETAKQTSGMSYVLVAATHTHSGPAIEDEYPPHETPAWETAAVERIAQAIEEAHEGALEARLGAGYGVADIGHNRLRVNPDGTVTWFEINKTMVPTAPVDPAVSVLRVDTAEGKPLAILVNYACHPVVFGGDNRQYSADFPGVTIKTVERGLGGQPLGIFLQGAPGDINPYYAVTPLEQDALKMRDWTGDRLGQEAARVAKTIQTAAVPEARLDFAEDLLPVRLRWDQEKIRQLLLASRGPQAVESFDRQMQAGIRLPVATVLINKQIALMTMPGEPFVEFQIEWRRRCPVRDALFMGYANGNYGYFPTIRAASLGGYGAANSATRVEVGAGERMVNHAIRKLYEMLGRLTDAPEDLRK